MSSKLGTLDQNQISPDGGVWTVGKLGTEEIRNSLTNTLRVDRERITREERTHGGVGTHSTLANL